MSAPTRQDFERLFNGFLDHPGSPFSFHWFALYQRCVRSSSVRPRLTPKLEQFLEAMGFDHTDPILQPEDKEWAEDRHVEWVLREEGEWSSGQCIAIEDLQKWIWLDRVMRGVALREGGQEGTYFLYKRKLRRSAFALVDVAPSEDLAFSNFVVNWTRAPRRAVINDQSRTLVAILTKEDGGDFQLVLDALASIVRDKNSPEFGYKCHIVLLLTTDYDDYDFVRSSDPGEVKVSAVIIGRGPAFNKKVNAERSFLICEGKAKKLKNDVALLPEGLALQEQARYTLHNNRKKLMKIAGDRKIDPPKPRIF